MGLKFRRRRVIPRLKDIFFKDGTLIDDERIYGRGLEIASGVGMISISIVLLIDAPIAQLHPIILDMFSVNVWVWLLTVLEICQIKFSSLSQRIVFDTLAAMFWCHLATSSIVAFGGLNIVMAIALPYTLCLMYVFGYLMGFDLKNYNKKGE